METGRLCPQDGFRGASRCGLAVPALEAPRLNPSKGFWWPLPLSLRQAHVHSDRPFFRARHRGATRVRQDPALGRGSPVAGGGRAMAPRRRSLLGCRLPAAADGTAGRVRPRESRLLPLLEVIGAGFPIGATRSSSPAAATTRKEPITARMPPARLNGSTSTYTYFFPQRSE